MAKFRKKLKDGRIVEFDMATYEELTGSAAFLARRRLIKSKQRIPFQLQRGDQAKGFDRTDITPPVADAPIIIKLDENINYIAMPRANYLTKMERQLLAEISGANARRSTPFPETLYNQVRSQISASIEQLPATVMILAEDTAFTGSYNITSASYGMYDAGIIQYSGIAGNDGYLDRLFNNNSPTATGASWSFANTSSIQSTFVNGVAGNEFHQNEFTSSFIIRTWASASFSGSHITGSDFANPNHSQSRIDSGKFQYYEFRTPSSSTTGSVLNTSTAGYYSTVLKANIFGDGNETLFSASFNDTGSALYAPDREILTFPYDTVVASGSFFWCNSFETLIGLGGPGGAIETAKYRPIRKVEIFWASGSGGLSSGSVQYPNSVITTLGDGQHLSGSIAPSHILPDSDTMTGMQSGSHLFYDKELSRPASGGYYLNSMNRTSESRFNAPTAESYWIATLGDNEIYQAPEDREYFGTVPTGHVIFIAGEGINSFGDPGEGFAQTPFADAHTLTGSKVIPAATRWNGQSFAQSKATGEINPVDYDDSND